MINPPIRVLSDSLLSSAGHYENKSAVIVEGTSYTYRDIKENALKLAKALKVRGVEKGDRVAIYMDNTWSCIISIYATSLSGGVFLIINPQTKQDKLKYILNDSGSKILLTDSHLKEVFLSVLPDANNIKGVIHSGESIHHNDFINRSTIIERLDEVLQNTDQLENSVSILANDLAALIYTSGSTGNPKGVMHTNMSIVFAIGSLLEYLRIDSDHVILNVLPMAFDYGLYQLLMSISAGATLVLERSFTYPAQIFKRIIENNVTVFPAVPTILSMLLSIHSRNKLSFPSITRVTNTAATLPDEYVPALKEIFPNALIYKMYGLTECKRVSYLEPELLEVIPGSVGKAIPGTEVFLLSEEGNPVSAGQEGILHVRGPHVMLGYWNQPELSREMLREGKWPYERILCTHDWFKQDEEGFLYFVGRSDDIIKTRGEKVSPIEVENVLHGIPGVIDAAVIGVTDELFGEAIHAYVSIEDDSKINERLLKMACMSKLENFMVPSKYKILPELPKTATGKVSKKLLHDWE